METKKLHLEALALHVGQEQPDPARAVPIYQTTSYVFRNSQHAFVEKPQPSTQPTRNGIIVE